MFEYSKVKYVNNHTKVCLMCLRHGEFWITPNSHLSKTIRYGCRRCSSAHISKPSQEWLDKIEINFLI